MEDVNVGTAVTAPKKKEKNQQRFFSFFFITYYKNRATISLSQHLTKLFPLVDIP